MKKTITSLFVLIAFSLAGKSSSLRLFSDSTSYLIGQEALVTIEHVADQHFSFLPFDANSDTLNSRLEVLEVKKPDTLTIDGKKVYQQTFSVTAWDTGHFIIYPRQALLNDSVLESNPILLSFTDIQINEQSQLKPIKGQLDAPWNWKEIKEALILIACILLLLAGIVVGIYLYLKNKKKQTIQPSIPSKSKIEILWERFNQLQESEIWKNGEEKEFHSQLSSILRGYLDLQYKIKASEATSSEIISNLRNYTISATDLQDIEFILNFSDRIKFAKGSGSVNQHENALASLKQFLLKVPAVE